MEKKHETEQAEPIIENGENESNESTGPSELETLRNEILYQRAEFENYKKRIIREQEQAVKFANERILKDLLPVVDLFDRALLHAPKSDESKDVKSFLSGIEITRKELLAALSKSGIEFFGTVGEKFDPIRHEAVSQRPVTGKEDPETVLEVHQKGCTLFGRLVNPAKVTVGVQSSE